jgi:ubiquinone/menaquinone biosynthesis C-methylase UbiE
MPTDAAEPRPSPPVAAAQQPVPSTTSPPAADLQPHYGLQLEILETLSSARNYNDWIASLAFPHLGDDPIEIGSGLGDQAERWLARGTGRLTLSDLEHRSVEALGERFATDRRVSIRRVDLLRCPPGSFSAAVAINVIEHMEDDVAALRGARSLVREDGRVVVLVPAFPIAMSRFDREIGHYRRYTGRSLAAALEAAGLEPLVVRYVNAPGLVAWVLMMRLLRMRPSGGALVRAWDRTVVPLARRIEARAAVPFGQSVFAVSAPRAQPLPRAS